MYDDPRLIVVTVFSAIMAGIFGPKLVRIWNKYYKKRFGKDLFPEDEQPDPFITIDGQGSGTWKEWNKYNKKRFGKSKGKDKTDPES